jgi:F-type H+-transporting ATPase subunit a
MLNNFKNILIEIDKEVNKFNLLSNNYDNNNLEGLGDIIINLSNKTFEVSGPLDQFNVTALVGLKFDILGKFYLALTNISLYLALVLTVIISIFYYGDNDSRLIPNKWSIILETFFASLKGMVKDQIGLAYEVYLPLIFSIFFFFLTGNLISNIPYSFAVNASAIVSIGYSLTFLLAVTIISLFKHGNKFFRNFIPEGTPLALVPLLVAIEFTSYTARGFSLGVRMFANLFSGHCLLAILSVFGNQLLSASWQTASLTVIFALPIFLAIIGLEVAVSFIQSFVLSLLSCSYIREAVVLH